MDGAAERDIPERGIAVYALTCEQDNGFRTVIVNGFNALHCLRFKQFDGWTRRELGVAMWLQNSQERGFE